MGERRRLVTLFPTREGRVLLEKRERQPYLLRLGAWEAEIPARADVLAVAAERLAALGVAAAGPWREGLPVDVDDQSARKPLAFRLYPVAVEVAAEPAAAVAVPPDELIILCATNQATPELDEAWARVGDRIAALPPQFRDEARAIAADDDSDTVELAIRGAALVVSGAPPERVAALRPFSAMYANGVRASARASRDVPAELREAFAALCGRVADAVGRRRAAVVARGSTLRRNVEDPEIAVILADAVLQDGTTTAPADIPDVPRVIVSDPHWDAWPDTIPPPLDGRSVKVAASGAAPRGPAPSPGRR